MQRIAMVVLSGYPSDPRVRREAEALEHIGIEVDVYCTRHPGESRVEKFGAITAIRLIDHRTDKESMSRYIEWSLRFMAAVFPVLFIRTLTRKYRCIQVHNLPDYLVFATIPQKLMRIPVILDLHDLSVELYGVKWNGNRANYLKKAVAATERLACRFADAVITTSEGFREKLISRGIPPEKITLVLNTADDRIFQFQKRDFHPLHKSMRLLYHGTVSDRFGIETAIQAVDILKHRIPGIRFTIHGKYDPSCRERLEALVSERNLKDHVTFGTYVPLEQIRDIIRGSDVGIVPYESDPFMHIALSTKAFEYVAMGLPVVASRLESLERIFDGGCVRYFTPGSPQELAEVLFELGQSPHDRRMLAENAVQAYRPICWNTMAERYRNLVLELMENGEHVRVHSRRARGGAHHVHTVSRGTGLALETTVQEQDRPRRRGKHHVRRRP